MSKFVFVMAAVLSVALGASALEVSNEPVAFVVEYDPDTFNEVDLQAEDITLYSVQITEVRVSPGRVVSQSTTTLQEMEEANVPIPEKRQPLPNEAKARKRLVHAPSIEGTVVGDVTVLDAGPKRRVVLVTGLRGEGLMGIKVREGTGWSQMATAKKSGLSEMVTVRPARRRGRAKSMNSSKAYKSAKALAIDATPDPVKAALKAHYPDGIPASLKVVAKPVRIEAEPVGGKE